MGQQPLQLELAIDLINSWDDYNPDPELLRSADFLKRWLKLNGCNRAARAINDEDVERFRALRGRLTDAFDARSANAAVRILNELLAEYATIPQLEQIETRWRMRHWPPESEGFRFVAALTATGLLEAITAGDWDRFGRCAASPCHCAYVDHSKNRSRRFCGHLCADRVAQAASRQRRRSKGA